MQTLTKILYAVLAFGILSCNSTNNNQNSQSSDDKAQNSFENFASQLEISIKKGDYKFLNTSWDIDLFKQKVTALGKVNSNVLDGGEKYYRKVLYKSNNDMVFEVKKYGEFYLSKFHFENNVPKAFYTYKTDLGINFIEFVFSQKGNEIKIVDYYNFQIGEYYSESVKKLIDNISRYGNDKGAYVDAMQLTGLAISQLNDKKTENAWETINAIDSELLKNKYFQNKRLIIASRLSNEKFCEAIEDFLAIYPDNEKLRIYYEIILFNLKNNKKKLNVAIKEMEEIVGKSELFTNWKRNL